MRYFKAPTELFDAMRLMVMATLGQPNAKAIQPWPEGLTSIALCPHEYEPQEYANLFAYSLANGAEEITEAEYKSLQPVEPNE